MKYKAENGETVTVLNDVQAAAFEKAGFKPVDDGKGAKKTEEK